MTLQYNLYPLQFLYIRAQLQKKLKKATTTIVALCLYLILCIDLIASMIDEITLSSKKQLYG